MFHLMEDVMGLSENADVYKLYESKMDEKFDNVYDNYQNMMSKSPIDGSDYSYMGSGFGGYCPFFPFS